MSYKKNSHFSFALKIYGLTLLLSPFINFLFRFHFSKYSDFSFGHLLASMITSLFFLVLALPTFYSILFFTKNLFNHNKPKFYLRFILFGLCAFVFTLNISILIYLGFGLTNILYHFYTTYYIIMFFLVLLLKIEPPEILIRKSSNPDILDDDLDFKK